MTSRRRFLQIVGGAGLTLAGCQSSRQQTPALAQNPAPPASDTPVRIAGNRVVVARDPAAVAGPEVDAERVARLLSLAVSRLSVGGPSEGVWGALLKSSDVVAIKVNCLAGPPVASHPPVVDAIAAALREMAWVPEDRIIVYDRDTAELAAAGFDTHGRSGYRCLGSDRAGYDLEPTVSGLAGSCYSRIVSEAATAIVNVPVLKDHDLAGLSGALKNHFGSIHNPNKMHTDHCTPYVADVNAAPHVRDKHRLVVCDALLVCYDGGPGYKPDTTHPYGGLIVSTDPVAADVVGFGLIEELRKADGLPPIAGSDREPRYLQVAADAGHRLGIADLSQIEVEELTV